MFPRSVGDTLFKIRGFSVGLTVILENDDSRPNKNGRKYSNNDFFNVSRGKFKKEDLYFKVNSLHKKMISFETSEMSDEGGWDKRSMYFTQASFQEMLEAFSICDQWLRSQSYSYLFEKGAGGVIKSLGGPPPYHPMVNRNANEYIRFKPAIVEDERGNKQEGIAITSHNRPIVKLGCKDYMTLSHHVGSYLKNSYADSLTLVNTAMTYAIFKKLNGTL